MRIVIKFAGALLEDAGTVRELSGHIAALARDGHEILVVHGGGRLFTATLQRMGIESKFVCGLRVTDAETLEAVVAVLAGAVNKQLVAELSQLGAPAIGLSGADSMILQAVRFDRELGFVGRIERVNPFPLEELLRLGYLPVVAPIAIEAGANAAQLLNTNADTAAGEIAAALHAERLVFLTDVAGVLGKDGQLLSRLSAVEASALIASGVAGGGMIPKLEACLVAAAEGCVTAIVSADRNALRRLADGGQAGTVVSA